MNNKNTLTLMQSKAISHGSGNALVSASAGSGKTFVVIERIIRLILEENVSVSEILAITFTKLAAGEMKDKLKEALTKKYVETKDARLKKEIDLINTADISTIDAFCSKIVKKYFYLLGIDANFSVLEESRKKILEKQAVDGLFERLYEEKNAEFLSLIPVFSHGRTDNGLKNAVKELYLYSEAENGIDYVREKTVFSYQNALELLTEEYSPKIKSLAKKYVEEFSYLGSLFVCDEKRKNYCDLMVELLNRLYQTDNYFEFFNNFVKTGLSLPSGKSKNLEFQAELTKTVQEFRKSFKDVITVFNIDVEEENEKLLNSLNLALSLIDLTKQYKMEFERLKAEENTADFNDVEKLCLSLLRREDISKEIKNEYKYVFVDEYQDVNAVQEEMISLITKDNAFLVGDSKQSIYAFRGCNPLYFKRKYDLYSNGSGAVISLDNNFRSSKSVINLVNDVFSNVMTEEFGGTNYFKNPMIYGGGYESDGLAQIHLIEKNEKQEVQLPERGVYSVMNATELKESEDVRDEVKLILNIVSNSLNQTYYDVKEKDATKRYKKVEFKDICILLRSIGTGSNLGEEIVSELIKNGVPVSSTVKKSISEYPEIKVIVNLISALVCAERDVPLATVMLNLYNFSEDELYAIREQGGQPLKSTFYSCVKNLSNKGGDLAEKCKRFLAWFNEKRLIAEFLPVGEVLNSILQESGYLAKTVASPYGKARLKRIERFIAESVQGSKKLRLNEFEEHVNSVLEDLTVSESSGDDTVKVMTMHASKGLEFPIVIVAGVSKRFNDTDSKKAVIKDRELGIAVKSFNDSDMTYSENSTRYLLKHKLKKVTAVEELRLFYVALTRAKYALHVTVSGELNETLDVYSVNKMSDFINKNNKFVSCESKFEDFKFVNEGEAVAGKEITKDLTDSIVNSLSYRYPFKNEITLPVKSSVSDVNKGDDEEYFYTTKEFGSSSAENGTAYHRFFQLIDFNDYNGEKDLQKFVLQGDMDERQASFIDADKVGRILRFDLFKEIKDHALYKEYKFCHLVPACEVTGANSSEKVLIQGILDLVAIKDNQAILIDYKVSTVKDEKDLIKIYSTQMKFYKNAVESILGIKVKKVALVNVLKEKVIII